MTILILKAILFLIPLVSWGEWETTPTPCHSFLNHLTVHTSLKVLAYCLDYLVFSSVDVSGFSSGTNNAGLLKCFPCVFNLA